MWVSILLALGFILNIGCTYLASYLWKNCGFDITLFVLNFANLLNSVGILLSRDFFILEIFIARGAYGYLLIF